MYLTHFVLVREKEQKKAGLFPTVRERFADLSVCHRGLPLDHLIL